MVKLKLLTTKKASELLGLTQDYVRRLCSLGKIKAERYGHDWLFPESSLKNIKRQRKEKDKEA